MAVVYRRPGVYLEESQFNNPPANIGSSQAAAVFVGAAQKGPVGDPVRVESWSDYIALYGGFNRIENASGGPAGQNDVYLAANTTALDAIPNPRQGDVALVNAYRYQSTRFYRRDSGETAQSGYDLPHSIYVYTDIDTGWEDTQFKFNTDNSFFGTSALSYMETMNAGIATSGIDFKLSSSNSSTHALPSTNVNFGDVGLHYDSSNTSWSVYLYGNNNYSFANSGTAFSSTGSEANSLWSTSADGWQQVSLTTQDTLFASGGMDVDPDASATWSIFTHDLSSDDNKRESLINLSDLPSTLGAVGALEWTGWTPDLTGTTSSGVTALPYLPYAVNSFFQNGGRTAYIIRSASTTAAGTKATLGNDYDDLTSTAFSFEAIGVGTWGNDLSVNCEEATTVDGAPVFTVRVLLDGTEVERFPNVAMSSSIAGVKALDTTINDPGTGSRYVSVINFDESVTPVLDTSGTTRALSTGTDPELPSSIDLVNSATDNVTKIEGALLVNIVGHTVDPSDSSAFVYPTGLTSSQIVGTSGRQDIFVINDACPQRASGKTSREYINQDITSTLIGAGANDSYMAVYTPWVVIPDPSTPGGTLSVPPGGSVMGVVARTDATNGVFRSPAGVIASITNALGVDTKFTDTEQGDLNQGHVNVIRPVAGAGIAVMGARTRKKYGVDMYVAPRRTLIYLKEILRDATQFAVFENNDERLWARMRGIADQVLRPLWTAGGLRGSSASEAYFIQCDATINTPTVIASGEVRMEVGVALEYPAEFVVIRVSQFDGTIGINEIQPTT